MESGAVPPRGRLAPLADLALVVAVPAAPVLGFAVGEVASGWLGLLVFAAGVWLVRTMGRSSIGVAATFRVVIMTWVTLAVGLVIAAFFAFGDCYPRVTDHQWERWVLLAVPSLVYVAVGLPAVRTRKLLGVPIAAAAAVLIGVILYRNLPGHLNYDYSLCPE